MGTPNPRNMSALVKPVIAELAGVLLAGGAGDAAEIDGDDVNRTGFNSALLLVTCKGVITASKTLTVAVQLQHADDSAGAAGTYADLGATYAVTSEVIDDSTTEGMIEVSLDLSEVKEWIRVQITPTFSNTATDTGEVAAVWVLGGAEVLPAQTANIEALPS